MPYPAIADHGVIGDLHTVALVAKDATIDFFCAPQFDSPTVFASLLDQHRGGCFELRPVLKAARTAQMYLPDTNILLTRFLSPDGVAEVSDFMPIGTADKHQIVRRAKAIKGDTRFRLRLSPRFDYARSKHRVHRTDAGLVFEPDGPGPQLRLRASVPVTVRDDGDVEADFDLRCDGEALFILDAVEGRRELPPLDRERATHDFKTTANYWRQWIGNSTYRGRWTEEVHRSALVLKLLFSAQHGSLVAAPTFGLPEHVGGTRNWDYRYTWIRDAAFTLYALIRLGMTEETHRFMHWVESRCVEFDSPTGPLQPLYGIDGRHEVEEGVLDHFEGYEGSTPVRIGNAAYKQLQLDLYGALMDAVYLYDKYANPVSYKLWQTLSKIVDWVCDHWRDPDEGIWEPRSGRREYLSSRVLCWVAVDRAIRLSDKRGLPSAHGKWRDTRDAIYRSVFDQFWDAGRKTFVQYKGAGVTDASSMLMPLMRFISPTDPMWTGTMRAMKKELVLDTLVHRYHVSDKDVDGFVEPEGTFSLCSFWYAECLSRGGDVQMARYVFEKNLTYANHLGLFAEQLGPSGEQLGNFPQAFTHLALISAAFDINRRLNKAGWEA
jgi:GH15 family glucan-1,4-alpha-glucosidase